MRGLIDAWGFYSFVSSPIEPRFEPMHKADAYLRSIIEGKPADEPVEIVCSPAGMHTLSAFCWQGQCYELGGLIVPVLSAWQCRRDRDEERDEG